MTMNTSTITDRERNMRNLEKRLLGLDVKWQSIYMKIKDNNLEELQEAIMIQSEIYNQCMLLKEQERLEIQSIIDNDAKQNILRKQSSHDGKNAG